MPVFVIFILFNIDLNKESKIKVALAYENDEIKNIIHPSIMEYSKETIDFFVCENKDELIKSVSAYKTDCGYFFKAGDYKNSIELYKTKTTTSDTVLNIFLSTLVMQRRSGEMGEKVLHPYIKEIDAEEILQDSYEYSKNGSLMKIKYRTTGGEIQNENSFDKLFYGLFALTALFISILNSSRFIKERNSDLHYRIKMNNLEFKNDLSQIFSLFLSNIFYLSVAHIILGLVYKVEFNFFQIIIADILFSLCVSVISFLIGKYFKRDNFIMILAVFLFLFNFAAGGLIFDISEIAVNLSFVKYFSILFYYLNVLR